MPNTPINYSTAIKNIITYILIFYLFHFCDLSFKGVFFIICKSQVNLFLKIYNLLEFNCHFLHILSIIYTENGGTIYI